MRQFYYLLFLSLFSLSIFEVSSQELKATESDFFKHKRRFDKVLAIKTNDSGKTGVVFGRKKHFVFDLFDQDMNRVHSKMVKIGRKEKYAGHLFQDNIIKIFSVYSPNRKERTLFIHTFHLGSKNYEKIKLFDKEIEKKQGLFSSRKNHVTSFSSSPDRKYYAIATDNKNKKYNAYSMRVYNTKNDQLVYQQSYQADHERKYEHNDMVVTNEGNVYSIGRLYKGEDDIKKTDYKFVLNKITQNNIKELDIRLEKKEIKNLNINKSESDINLTGFYADDYDGNIKGGCSFKVDVENFSLTDTKFSKLPEKVYQDIYNDRRAKRKSKKNKALHNYKLDHILKDKKGNTILVAEEFRTTRAYHTSGMRPHAPITQYHYDDILILKFDKKGELDWGRSIFKRANEPTYNAFLKDDHLHIIVNAGNNLKEKRDGRVKISKGLFESTALYNISYDIENGNDTLDKIQKNTGYNKFQPSTGTFDQGKFIMTTNELTRKKKLLILD